MKNIVIYIIFNLISFQFFGQNKTDLEISELIEKLNWETIPVICNYNLVLKEYDTNANKLVQIGKQANKQLLNQISNPEKSIGIHIILTRINEPNKYEKTGIEVKYVYKNCYNLIGWHYIYNGIVWEYFEKKGQIISELELKKLTEYWNNKLINNKKTELDDSKTIFKLLTESDDEKYPCTN